MARADFLRLVQMPQRHIIRPVEDIRGHSFDPADPCQGALGLTDRAARLVEAARKSGADAAGAVCVRGVSLSVDMRLGKVEDRAGMCPVLIAMVEKKYRATYQRWADLLREAGIPVARSVTIRTGAVPDFATLEAELGLPIFLKPARQGSSVGVRKVEASQEYAGALEEGFRHDRKLLAEEFIAGREIELAVLENPDGSLFVSCSGEIVPAEKPFDPASYEAMLMIDEEVARKSYPEAFQEVLEV